MLKVVYPTRLTECKAKCGALVEYKTNKNVYCEPCRLDAKRSTSRATMTRVRRAKGIAEVKNTKSNCSVCGTEFIRFAVHTHRCASCQLNAASELAKRNSLAKRSSEVGREYHRNWAKNRRAKDPSWRVSAHMTVMMHRALGKNKAGRSWRTFVDYSLEELMAHIERQFTNGMTWENRGKWHIDHILPRSSFQYDSPDDEQFKACWALSNLRPLWAQENLTKQASRLFLI